MRPTRSAPLLAALVLGALAPAGADALVTVSVSRSGPTVAVTGSAVLPDAPFAQVVQDATADADVIGANTAGDLIKVALSTQGDGDLVVRWSLASINADPAGRPGITRFRFSSGGAGYEVAAARADHSGGSTGARGWLLRCGTTTCAWSPAAATGGGTLLSRSVGVQFDFSADTITATVPVTALGGVLGPGSLIQPLAGTATEASTEIGQLEASREMDLADMPGTYPYGLIVSLGAGPTDSDPATIDYSVPATVDPDNVRFSGSLEVPAGQAVFVRACLGGPANCAFGDSGAV